MRIVCSAIVDEELQRGNLCKCVEILGGKADVSGNTVCVECVGSADTAAKFIALFEQFPFHGITTLP